MWNLKSTIMIVTNPSNVINVVLYVMQCNTKMFLNLPFAAAGDKIKFSESDPDIKSDIKSMIPVELRNFISQCEEIQKINDLDGDDVISTHVNSKYFNIKEFNSLKLDQPSSFGLILLPLINILVNFEHYCPNLNLISI